MTVDNFAPFSPLTLFSPSSFRTARQSRADAKGGVEGGEVEAPVGLKNRLYETKIAEMRLCPSSAISFVLEAFRG